MVATIVILFIVVLGVFWLIDFFNLDSNTMCDGNCNQGRNCTCMNKK